MKKTLLIIFLAAVTLASCAPTTIVIPTEAANPTSTYALAPQVAPTKTATPISVITPASTMIETPMHESIADSKDLSIWVDEFVHAYDGSIILDGVEMDAKQLTSELRENGEEFIQSKEVNSKEVKFLVVNEIPLAMKEGDGQWQEATMAELSRIANVEFEYGWDTRDLQRADILRKMFNENVTVIFMGDFQMDHLFGEFTPSDWRFVLNNWETIEQGFDEKKLPENLPYNWYLPDKGIREASEVFGTPQFRAQHLLWSFWDSTNDLAQVLDQLSLNQDEMLKVLEFMVRTRVIKYPMVNKWDVSDEIDLVHFKWTDPQDILWQNQIEYWTNHTGTTSAEITALNANWVKKDNPNAKTYVLQDNQFDNINPEAKWTRDGFDKFVPELAELDAPIDYITIENNLWVYAQPDLGYVSQKIDWIRSYGFEIGGAETMMVMGDEPINPSPRRVKINEVESPKIEQAKMYADWLSLYLKKSIKVFGFGGATDVTAWTNAVGQENADPLLFDDEFRAKPAYYAIIQVLYQYLP